MSRLPTPGGDDGTWGDILNDFLDVSHNADGTLKGTEIGDAGGLLASNNLSDLQNPSTARTNLGTISSSDSRLTDARTPTDGSVTDAKVAPSAAIDVSKLAAGSDGNVLKTAGSSVAWSSEIVSGIPTVLNVKDAAYGAVGDGVADDSAAIQTAINDAFTAGGGIVYLPPATYLVNSQIQVKNRVRLVGTSRGVSILKAGASFPISTALVRLGDGTGGVTGCRVEYMKLDCSDIVGSQAVMTTEANEVSGVFNSVLVNFTDIGIYFNGSGSQNCGVDTCEIYGSTSNFNDGIFVNGSAAIYIFRVTTHDNGAGTGTNGIHVQNADALIANSHGERTTNGIYFDTGGGGTVQNYIGRATLTNAINIASGNGGGITLAGISQNGSTVTVNNQSRSETITDTYVSHYVFSNIGAGAGVLKNSYHSQNSPAWRVGALIRAIQGLSLGDSGSPTVTSGSGAPLGNVSAPVGSLYLRTDGGTDTSIYKKESGAGATGWVAIAAASPSGTDPAAWTWPTGAVAATYTRSGVTGATRTAVSGTLYMDAIYIPSGTVVSNFNIFSTTASSGGTHCWIALFDNTRAQLAVTADDTSAAAFSAGAVKTMVIATIASGAASSFTTTYSGLYYVGVMVAASGLPTFLAVSEGTNSNAITPIIAGSSASTGQTTPHAFPFTAGVVSAGNNHDYIWLT